jgi:hypothetical protein
MKHPVTISQHHPIYRTGRKLRVTVEITEITHQLCLIPEEDTDAGDVT